VIVSAVVSAFAALIASRSEHSLVALVTSNWSSVVSTTMGLPTGQPLAGRTASVKVEVAVVPDDPVAVTL
jgi:hypothetical protein